MFFKGEKGMEPKGEENSFAVDDFCKDIINVYLKHGYGDEKLYSILFTHTYINEDTRFLTIQEFFDKYCKKEEN